MAAVKRNGSKQPNWIVPGKRNLWKSAKSLKLAKEFIFPEKEGITCVFEQPRQVALGTTLVFEAYPENALVYVTFSFTHPYPFSFSFSVL